jgi:hypothetical protein
MQLAPASAFNPTTAWESAKKKEQEDAAAQAAEAAADLKAAGGKAKKATKEKEKTTAEKIQERNAEEKKREKLVAEVTRIRNTKNNLKSLLREVSTVDARRVLIVEILKRAIDDGNREGMYEALWAVDEIGLSEFNAPQPLNPRPPKKRPPSPVTVVSNRLLLSRRFACRFPSPAGLPLARCPPRVRAA